MNTNNKYLEASHKARNSREKFNDFFKKIKVLMDNWKEFKKH